MNTVRYGILGCGMMGKEHVRNLALIDGAAVSAIADTDADMQASNRELVPNARFCSTLEELLAGDDIDALLIASPNFQHADQLLHVLANTELPILVEKPICTRFEDVARLAAAFDKHPAPVWVAMEYRYMPPVQAVRESLEAGTAGPVQMLSIIEHRFPFLEKVGDWNRFNRYSGGTLVEKCCHYFDLMRLLIPSKPIRLYATGAADHNHKDELYAGEVPDIMDNAYVVVDFEDGQRAMLELCMFAEGSRYQESIIALGPKAKVECDIPGPTRFWPEALGAPPVPRIVVSPRNPAGPIETPVPVPPELLDAGDHNGSTYYQHQLFFKAVLGHQTAKQARDMADASGALASGALLNPKSALNAGVEVSALDGLRAVVMGMAAQQSIATGQAVQLSDDGLSYVH